MGMRQRFTRTEFSDHNPVTENGRTVQVIYCNQYGNIENLRSYLKSFKYIQQY